MLLDAIAASAGTRADVLTKMVETEVTDGLIGSFGFNENGDPVDATGAIVGFTIYKATDAKFNGSSEVVVPKPETVKAAGA